jgi:hypothetical protein
LIFLCLPRGDALGATNEDYGQVDVGVIIFPSDDANTVRTLTQSAFERTGYCKSAFLGSRVSTIVEPPHVQLVDDRALYSPLFNSFIAEQAIIFYRRLYFFGTVFLLD